VNGIQISTAKLRLFLDAFLSASTSVGIAVSKSQITGPNLTNNENERRICTTLRIFRKIPRFSSCDICEEIAVFEERLTSLFSISRKSAINRRRKRESRSCSLIIHLRDPFSCLYPLRIGVVLCRTRQRRNY